MLEVKNVYKNYDKTEVLHGVSLELKPGEIHGLIGENSAGKTTLIKCVTGIYKANKGKIVADGESVYDNPKAKRIIGYVADDNEYVPAYSPEKMANMYQCFYPQFDMDKFNSLNDIFKLPLEKSIRSFSKGQKMRLAIMLEIARKPKYLILDEPAAGLDAVAKAALFELLVKEAEENQVGILISSHNLKTLEMLCDSVTMIHQGKTEYQASVEDMKKLLSKVQVVFENGADAGMYACEEILHISNTGSIYSLLIRRYDDKMKAKLKEWGAGFVEESELGLEELFVALEQHREEVSCV